MRNWTLLCRGQSSFDLSSIRITPKALHTPAPAELTFILCLYSMHARHTLNCYKGYAWIAGAPPSENWVSRNKGSVGKRQADTKSAVEKACQARCVTANELLSKHTLCQIPATVAFHCMLSITPVQHCCFPSVCLWRSRMSSGRWV